MLFERRGTLPRHASAVLVRRATPCIPPRARNSSRRRLLAWLHHLCIFSALGPQTQRCKVWGRLWTRPRPGGEAKSEADGHGGRDDQRRRDGDDEGHDGEAGRRDVLEDAPDRRAGASRSHVQHHRRGLLGHGNSNTVQGGQSCKYEASIGIVRSQLCEHDDIRDCRLDADHDHVHELVDHGHGVAQHLQQREQNDEGDGRPRHQPRELRRYRQGKVLKALRAYEHHEQRDGRLQPRQSRERLCHQVALQLLAPAGDAQADAVSDGGPADN
mmetsp:Transcript_40728/g.103678  ORF Transcript_40728/g.103678 Transcript_40728/m.103678 type:complete len:271 (+) Transcript_40728:92-904(+)